MLIHKSVANLMARGGVYLESNDGNGNDLGAGSEADKLAAEKAAAEKVAAETKTKEAEEALAREVEQREREGGKKPSDEEARLLKEVMKRKEDVRALQAELEKTTTALKQFEGIDVESVRKMLDAQKEAETKALEDKGEWERLKARMGEEHVTEKTKLQTEIEQLKEELNKRDGRINDMTVGGSFTGSEFIAKELTLTPSKARVIYGGHFELNEEGQVVGYDKPKGASNRTALVDSAGNPVSFDAALRKIVEADADKEHLMKSGVRAGAQSASVTGRGGKEDEGKAEKTGVDKIAAGLGALLSQKDK